MIFEPISYRDAGIANYNSYPLGTVIMSTSEDIDPDEWLQCNGRYINQLDYPLLAEYLGKHNPGVEDTVKLTGNYSGTFSTSYKYDGYIWVYWFDGAKLIGFPIGEGETKEISIANNFDFVEDVDAPVVLSICGGRIFLCQTVVNIPYTYIYSAEFNDNIDTSTSIEMAKINNTVTYGNVREYNIYVPEVIFVKDYNIDNTTQKDCFLIVDFSTAGSSSSSYYYIEYYALIINSDDLSITRKKIYSTTNTYYGDIVSPVSQTLFRFGHKVANECIILDLMNVTSSISSSSIKAKLVSYLNGTYNSSVEITMGDYSKLYFSNDKNDPIVVSPIANTEFYIYRAYIEDQYVYIRAGLIDNFTVFEYNKSSENSQKLLGIKLPPFAKLFQDSMEYIENHNIFIIFVGTGICFSHTPLDMSSWGYFDTTEYFGIINQLGCAEFDSSTNTLCLSGLGSEGNYVCGKLKFHEKFDYSNDGAWLPYIVSNGVPAFIKTTEAEEDSSNRKLKFTVKNDNIVNNTSVQLNNYFAITLNGDQLVHNMNYTRIVPNDTEYFNIGIKCIKTYETNNGYIGKLYINDSYLTELNSKVLDATNDVALLWKDFSGTVKLEIKYN